MSVQRENTQATECYGDVIKAASESKLSHELKLACELVGYHYKKVGNNEKEGSLLQEARNWYN